MCTLSCMTRWLAVCSILSLLAAAPAVGQRAPARRLLAYLPTSLGGVRAVSREVADTHSVHAAYRTDSGFINVNLSVTRSVSFDRAQVRGAEDDTFVQSSAAGEGRGGVAVGRFRALYVAFHSGSQTELRLFLEDRINVSLSIEGRHTPEAMVALAAGLDLEGLARLASRQPSPDG
jgi:hypothetical protein